MENNKDNKTTVFICLFVILIAFLYAFLSNNKNDNITNSGEEYFHNYDVNEVQNIYVSLEEVATKYLSSLVSMSIYNKDELYDILDQETKEKYSNKQDFYHMIESIKTINYLNAKVAKYSSYVINDKNAIYVIDSANNTFIFIEDSINNYKIRIN